MRRVLLCLCCVVLLVACDGERGFVVEGTMTNAEDGEMVCLSYPIKRDGVWLEQRDTTYVDSGRFRFEGEVSGVVPAVLSMQNRDEVQLFIEPANIKFSAERSTLYDYSLSGLSVDDDIREYRGAFGEYNKAIYEKLYEVMRKNEEWVEANNAGLPNADTLWAEFYAIVMEHHAIGAKWPNLAVEFIQSNPNNSLVPSVIDGLIDMGYDATIVDSLISASTERQQNRPLWELMTIHRDISRLNGGEVGSKALDFTLRSIDDSRVVLSECYAEGYVLLDFWASWCRPCINEIPKLKSLYSKCSDRLQILSLSVDREEVEWREAVAQHNLSEWPQLIVERKEDADSYYFPSQADISLAYDVQEIPCFILIDSNGLIVGRWSHLTPEVVAEIESVTGQ
ncbi:MAG: AhpC/TSA family protein [Alistipes sp.]|nr:AhpC/TSA family protein [Alistipes sp.]